MIAGASFTGVTVTSKVSFVVVVPSLTVTVIVTGPPFWFAAGTAAIVQLPPPRFTKVRLPLGISVVSLLTAVTVKAPAAVSTSLTVKGSAPVVPSSAIV